MVGCGCFTWVCLNFGVNTFLIFPDSGFAPGFGPRDPVSAFEEIESRDGRVHYELVRGSGPTSGWVTPNLRGKDRFSLGPCLAV